MYDATYIVIWLFTILLSFTLLALFCRAIYSKIKINGFSASSGFLCGYTFFLIFPLIFLSVNGIYDKPVFREVIAIPNLNVETAFPATVFLFLTGLTILFLLKNNSSVKEVSRSVELNHYSSSSYLKLLTICGVSYVLLVFYDLVFTGAASADGHWYLSRQDAMVSSQFAVLVGYIKHAVRIVTLASLFYGLTTGYLKSHIFYILLLLFVGSSVYFSGNRFVVALSGIMLFLYFLQKGMFLRIVLLSLFSLPILWFGTVFMVVRSVMYDRDTSFFSLMFEKSLDVQSEISYFIVNSFEGINFNLLNAILRDFPSNLDCLYGATLIKPFIFWIPRSIWEDKPLRLSQILGIEYAGDEYLSLVSTFYGELWANFGYLYPLFLIIFVFLIVRIIPSYFDFSPIGKYICFFFLFTINRSSFAAIIIEMLIVFLFLRFLDFMVRAKFYMGNQRVL